MKITIRGEHLKVVEKEHHSGHVLGTKKDLTPIYPSIQDMKMKTNTIGNQFNSIPNGSKNQLLNSQCMSHCGSQVWNIQEERAEEPCATRRKCPRN